MCMKKILLAGLVIVSFAACMKSTTAPPSERIYASMRFNLVQTPDTAQVGDTIKSQVIVVGSNTCYQFEGFNGSPSGADQYDIRAVGSIPNPALGTASCVDYPVQKDTFLTITPNTAGRLIFRFYNETELFQVDTIVIKP